MEYLRAQNQAGVSEANRPPVYLTSDPKPILTNLKKPVDFLYRVHCSIKFINHFRSIQI